VALPVLRLLSTVHATRVLVFGLLASLPSFLALFGLFAVRRAFFGTVVPKAYATHDGGLLLLLNVPCGCMRHVFVVWCGVAWLDMA